MDKREAAAVLAQCKWLKDNIKRWEEAAKTVLSHELEPGERAAAVDSEGVQLGFAAMVAGKREVKVENEEAFTAWVAQRWPTEMAQAIRPKFRKLLEDKAKVLGSLPDEIDGTICPYLTVVAYDQYPRVTLSEWADAVLSQRIKTNLLMDVITPPSEIPSAQVELSGNRTVEPEPELDPEPVWSESTTFENSDAVRQRRG